MEFKHKDLLNEFNRQVQSGEYEKVGGNGSIVILSRVERYRFPQIGIQPPNTGFL